MGKVINFHKVSNAQWFEDVVCLLKRHYTMIHAQQLLDYYHHHKPLPRKSCLVTVDDGDLSSYTIIYPVLKKHQVPAVFFVSPEKLLRNGKHRNFWFQEARHCKDADALMDEVHAGRQTIDEIWQLIDTYKAAHSVEDLTDQNMTLEQVLEIDREGLVKIGAHTMDHPFLARESDEKAEYEIKQSILQLEQLLGYKIELFAYPNGTPTADFGEREIEMLRRTSCKMAFTTNPCDFSNKDNPYAIPRYGLTTGSMRFIRMKLLLGRHYRFLRKLLVAIKTVKP